MPQQGTDSCHVCSHDREVEEEVTDLTLDITARLAAIDAELDQ